MYDCCKVGLVREGDYLRCYQCGMMYHKSKKDYVSPYLERPLRSESEALSELEANQ